MLRRFAAALVMLVFCVGILIAAEYKAKVVKIDGEKKVIEVQKEGAKKANKINVGNKGARLVGADGKFISINDVKEGAEVTVTTKEVEREKDGVKKTVQVPTEVKLNK